MFHSKPSDTDSDEEETPIQLNYIWIGPPPVAVQSTSPAIDFFGPHEMAAAAKEARTAYQVNFWCLNPHVKHYQQVFNGTAIQVKSIEDFLEKKSRYHPLMVKNLNEMKNTILKEGRNRNRDKVTFKCLFSLFLLAAEGDYVLDTNVRPMKNDQNQYILNLQRYPEFRIPALNAEVEESANTDCWMMHAPCTTDFSSVIRYPSRSAAKLAFEMYYQEWQREAEPIYAREGYSKDYHEKLAASIVDSVYAAARHQQKRFLTQPYVPATIFWRATTHHGSAGLTTFKQLGVEKHYYNTHWNFDKAPAAKISRTTKEKADVHAQPQQLKQQNSQDRFFKGDIQPEPSLESHAINDSKKRKR